MRDFVRGNFVRRAILEEAFEVTFKLAASVRVCDRMATRGWAFHGANRHQDGGVVEFVGVLPP